MPKKTRLTDKHPTSEKLQKVFALLQELNLTILVGRYGTVHIRDGDDEFEMLDAEKGPAELQFPPTFEYKLIYDNYDEEHAQEVLES